MTDLHFLTVAGAAKLIKARKLSPVELTDAYLERIWALDSQLNAYITVTAELARRQARACQPEEHGSERHQHRRHHRLPGTGRSGHEA